MANTFGTDILIQAQDPAKAARFYVEHLGFEITDHNPKMIGLHGAHINLFIELGRALGPVLEVTVDSVEGANERLVSNGCEIVKDEPHFPRCYVQDPYGRQARTPCRPDSPQHELFSGSSHLWYRISIPHLTTHALQW